jgi:hypothetical protein
VAYVRSRSRRAVLGNLAVAQLVKKLADFHVIRRFITVLTTARHWFLLQVSYVQLVPHTINP